MHLRALLALLVYLYASTIAAQVDPRLDLLDRVMETTKAMSVLSPVTADIVGALDGTAPDAAHARDVVARQFADTTLYRYVRESMAAEADSATLADLAAWLFSDWAEQTRQAADAEPSVSLEAYARGLREHPPAEARVRLMVRYATANRPGAFFLQRDDAVRDAIQVVASAASGDGPETTTLTVAEREEQMRRIDLGVLVSFLQRYERVSDADLQRLVEAYESPSGRWYVTAYSDAIAAAIRRAAQEAAAELRGS